MKRWEQNGEQREFELSDSEAFISNPLMFRGTEQSIDFHWILPDVSISVWHAHHLHLLTLFQERRWERRGLITAHFTSSEVGAQNSEGSPLQYNVPA